jgi:hypothetical protein
MLLISLLWSLIAQNTLYKNNNIINSEIDIHKDLRSGYDERYVHYYTNVTSRKESKPDISDIKRYMNILEKINKLQKVNLTGPYIDDSEINTILKDIDIDSYSRKYGLLSDW